MRYDVIIAGASFAGLSVASQLEGDILLIDRKEIGAGQTSACATFYKTLEKLGCENSVIQTFNKIVLHLKKREIKIKLAKTMCTFDYKIFCETFLPKGAKIIKTAVRGIRENSVVTDSSEFQSDYIADCTGWRAVLASSLREGFVDREKQAFGIETVVDYEDDALHFFLDPKIIEKGAAWIFPVDKKSRIGVASYVGRTNLMPELGGFLDMMDLEIGNDVHGGYIPYMMRDPTVDNVFLVGDSAGQVPPVTGEGIRKSVYFGKACGGIIQVIIDKKMTLEQGLKEYRNIVKRITRNYYRLMLSLQNFYVRRGVPKVIEMMSDEGISKRAENILERYSRV
jgi:flavin-dependent dehydrogenase